MVFLFFIHQKWKKINLRKNNTYKINRYSYKEEKNTSETRILNVLLACPRGLNIKRLWLKQNWKLRHCVKRQYRIKSIENIKCQNFWGIFWTMALHHRLYKPYICLFFNVSHCKFKKWVRTSSSTSSLQVQELLSEVIRGNPWVPFIFTK